MVTKLAKSARGLGKRTRFQVVDSQGNRRQMLAEAPIGKCLACTNTGKTLASSGQLAAIEFGTGHLRDHAGLVDGYDLHAAIRVISAAPSEDFFTSDLLQRSHIES